jgi:hypothetical protein
MNSKAGSILANEWFLATSVAAACFAVYLTTLCPTVSFIDAGELAAVASLLGIAHPTGYPLFTIVAHCALWIPIGGEEVFRLNVFSAVVVAASVGVFFRMLLVLSRMSEVRNREVRDGTSHRRPATLLASAVASLVLGLSTTVWAQSVAVEVYGLHLLLMVLTALFFLKGVEESGRNDREIPRRLFAAAFFLGLSFANHLTTLLIVPALIYLYISAYGLSRESAIRAFKLSPFFCLGLSTYLYLPIRSSVHPPLEWGFPAEIERLFWHVSGKQYRSWMFSSFDSAEKQLTYFIDHFSSEFNWLLIAVLLFGVWTSFRLNRRIFWFLVVAFLGCIFYSINYDIHDIDSYFLLSYVVAGAFIFFGIRRLLEYLPPRSSNRSLAVAGLLLLALPVIQLLNNRKGVSEADNYLVADYTHNVFSNTARDALILSYQWDYFVAPSLYFQLVRHERTDVAIVDKELLRRSWYFIYLKDRFPWLIERSKGEVSAFLAELCKFEHALPYNPSVIEARYVGMINSFLDNSMRDHPVYVGPEIEPEIGQQYKRVPSGLVFRLSQSIDSSRVTPIKIYYRPSLYESRLTSGIRGLYVRMLTATGAHFLSKSQLSDATDCIEKALSVDPTFAPARAVREQITKSSRQGKE